MKKLILTVAASLACLAAFAQGKVNFQNDSLRLAFYGSVLAPDAALAGQGVDSAHMPTGINLVADLYAGTSSSALSLVSSTVFASGGAPGKWAATQVTIPGVNGGSAVFLVTQIRNQASVAPTVFVGTPTSVPGTVYYGASSIFSFTLGSGVTYPVMWGATGTWQPGTTALDQYGAGSKGAIQVNAIPEPASFALAGLGLAGLAIFRRRK